MLEHRLVDVLSRIFLFLFECDKIGVLYLLYINKCGMNYPCLVIKLFYDLSLFFLIGKVPE